MQADIAGKSRRQNCNERNAPAQCQKDDAVYHSDELHGSWGYCTVYSNSSEEKARSRDGNLFRENGIDEVA